MSKVIAMVITHPHCLGSGCHFAMVSLYCRHCQNYKQGVKKKNMIHKLYCVLGYSLKLTYYPNYFVTSRLKCRCGRRFCPLIQRTVYNLLLMAPSFELTSFSPGAFPTSSGMLFMTDMKHYKCMFLLFINWTNNLPNSSIECARTQTPLLTRSLFKSYNNSWRNSKFF